MFADIARTLIFLLRQRAHAFVILRPRAPVSCWGGVPGVEDLGSEESASRWRLRPSSCILGRCLSPSRDRITGAEGDDDGDERRERWGYRRRGLVRPGSGESCEHDKCGADGVDPAGCQVMQNRPTNGRQAWAQGCASS